MMTVLFQSWIRLRALLGKEFLQLLRDPRMRFFVVLPPIVQLFVFGYAATFDVKNADVAVVDVSHSALSRALLADVTSTGHFQLHYYSRMADAAQAINLSRVRAVIHFAADFARSGAIQVIADGSDSNSALLVVGQLNEALNYSVLSRRQLSPQLFSGLQSNGQNVTVQQAALQPLHQLSQQNQLQQESSMSSAQPSAPPITVEYRAWYNPNLDDREYFVPGIIANVVLIATMMLTAMTVVREREIGTLERLMVTPLARLEFVVGKIVPVAFVGLFDVILVTVVAVAWFGVPFRGSPMDLLLGTVLYLMSTLGLGLVISSFSSTQQQAMLLAVFLVMPLVILSGFAFPIRNMPEVVQWFTYLDPLRYFLVVIRDIFLKGSGMAAHGFEFVMMSLLGALAMGVSMARIR